MPSKYCDTEYHFIEKLLFQSLGYVMLPFVCLTTVLFGLANTKDIFKIGEPSIHSIQLNSFKSTNMYETHTLQNCWSLIDSFAALSELQSAVDSGYQRSLER